VGPGSAAKYVFVTTAIKTRSDSIGMYDSADCASAALEQS